MADAPKILETDYLDEAFPKINKAIDNANLALSTSDEAVTKASDADKKAQSVQVQFNDFEQSVQSGTSKVIFADWVIGGIATDGTNNTGNGIRIRTEGYKEFITGDVLTITITSGYKLRIWGYDENYLLKYDSGFLTGNLKYTASYKYYRFLIGNVSDGTASLSFANYVSISKKFVIETFENLKLEVENVKENLSFGYERLDLLTPVSELTNQFYDVQGSSLVLSSATNAKTNKYLIEEKKPYIINGSVSGTMTLVIFCNANNGYISHMFDSEVIQGGLTSNIVSFSNEAVEAPTGAVYMYVATRNNTSYPVSSYSAQNIRLSKDSINNLIDEKLEGIGESDPTVISNIEFDLENAMQNIVASQKALGFDFKTFDKGYVSIIIDDSNYDVDLIAKICKEYGFPLSLATIPSKLNSSVSGITVAADKIGSTVKDVCQYVVANGGEILSHNTTVITAANIENFDVMYYQFAGTKKELNNAGFEIDGIILSGGPDELANDERTEKWARMYYKYSDRYGLVEPYNHPRMSIAKTALNTVKAKIDEIVANKTWNGFHCHGINNQDGTAIYANGFREAEFRTVLDYIKTYVDAGTLAVVPYGFVYKTFGVSKLEARLSLLE